MELNLLKSTFLIWYPALSPNVTKCRTCLPSVARKFARLAVDKENHLIAVGGREYEGASTAATSLLDWLENKWLQLLPDMISGHYRHGVCVTEDNSLAVIGGYANHALMTTIIRRICEASEVTCMVLDGCSSQTRL